MNNKTVGVMIVVAVIIGGGGFWGGMTYAQSKTPARGQFAGGNFGDGAGGRGARGGANGGAAFGSIIAKDANSLTVQLGGPNATSNPSNSSGQANVAVSGSKIVLYNASTEVGKTVVGSTSDLTVGEMVSVSGTGNSDGSITAAMIQIRPAGAVGSFRGNAPGTATGQ